jgi:hypothetical protein
VPADDGSLVFRGYVTVDDVSGSPIAAIARAQIVNGTGWPAGSFSERRATRRPRFRHSRNHGLEHDDHHHGRRVGDDHDDDHTLRACPSGPLP